VLGGRASCERFFAAFSFGRHVHVDLSGSAPHSPNVFAISDPEPGVTGYGVSVTVVGEAGALRVRFRPARINVEIVHGAS
jgi:hypothetical protein